MIESILHSLLTILSHDPGIWRLVYLWSLYFGQTRIESFDTLEDCMWLRFDILILDIHTWFARHACILVIGIAKIVVELGTGVRGLVDGEGKVL